MNNQRQIFAATIKDGKIYFCDKTGISVWFELLEGKNVDITIEREVNRRTTRQNNALHKYFELLADELNASGYDMREVLKPEVDIEWTTENVKNYIWRPVQKAQLGKESTTDLSTTDIDKIYETLTRHLGQKFGIYVPFPSQEEPLN